MSFPKYAEYKDSGVDWLGEVPAHWEVAAIKHIVSTPVTDGPHETPEFIDEGVPFVSAEAVSSGEIDFSKIRGFISEADHDCYCQKYKPDVGDIYMVKSGASTGTTAIVESDHEFSIWSPLAAIRCDEDSLPRFVLNFLRSRNFQEGVTLNWSFGTQQNIGMNVIENLQVTRPSMDEQTAIASFLDAETSKIDGLVGEQRRLIELLKEKRQAVISHAVTKGLNPNAPLKPSAIQWLGDVPEHWKVTRFGWICDYISYGFTNPMPTTDEGPYMLTANDIDYGNVKYETARRTSEYAFHDLLTDKCRPKQGDLLMTKDGTLGRIAIHDGRMACINQSVALLRVNTERVEPEFSCLALQGGLYQTRMIYEAGGTAIKHIYISRLAKMPFAIPDVDEQNSVVEFLHQEMAKLDGLITETERAIDLLQERRTALISAAVTGKIDVREFA